MFLFFGPILLTARFGNVWARGNIVTGAEYPGRNSGETRCGEGIREKASRLVSGISGF